MENEILSANLNALSKTNPEIFNFIKTCNRKDKKSRYNFCESKSAEIVPLYSQPEGNSRPLHSTVDPKREAQRLVSTITEETGFVVILGLGGGFVPQAVLEQTRAQALVIDFFLDEIADLFFMKDYTNLLNNERFNLLIDPSCEKIKNFIIDNYRPQLSGGIKTIPLRTRTDFSVSLFNAAAQAIQEAIEIVSSDYSVQAHFGRRWFSNIIRNLKFANFTHENPIIKNFESPINEAAIVAAGPSLNSQLPVLGEYKSRKVFIISCDTALPALLHHGIEPDAVVSIDCQHISYYHFIGLNSRNIPLILDIASPPLLASFTTSPLFFSSGHPLALYISQNWQNLPRLDTSGGNVTYACLSYAETLRVQRITLFGADFSYVNSETYARGTYIYPFFEKKQNRFSALEALSSSFLYRSPFLPAESGLKKNYYETSSLRFYRKKFEEKAARMNVQIIAMDGQGAKINLPQRVANNKADRKDTASAAKTAKKSGSEFLEQYRADIAALSAGKLNEKSRSVFLTLLPYAASVKRRNPALKANDLIEQTKQLCIEDINRVLSG